MFLVVVVRAWILVVPALMRRAVAASVVAALVRMAGAGLAACQVLARSLKSVGGAYRRRR